MSRYPENPDPDRSGSGSRSRTDLRANPKTDSRSKKKNNNNNLCAPFYDLDLWHLNDIENSSPLFEASINTDN